MDKDGLFKKINDLGMDNNNLTSEDYYDLLVLHMKGEFGKDVFKEFVKENNTTYKNFIDGLVKLTSVHETASATYLKTLEWLIKDLRKEVENATTLEEKKEIDKKIDAILDRIEKEADKNREHGRTGMLILAGVATLIMGSGIYLFTRNPELLKKGTQMIAQETVKQIVK
ncbi:hypothetical protein SAMN05877753_1054 [Bacillus oleivorans]|uniref:Uncharacterized protein n=1 Tax=Bacillus oleivorans TaxID=1448271 RepID=A0A285CVU4_9BACI|nr:hypothetical protein [Bacillus oleivorans]SNX71156.1 hypothetical protein SAMN05877753_1054 [Bacillus oleivorans]